MKTEEDETYLFRTSLATALTYYVPEVRTPLSYSALHHERCFNHEVDRFCIWCREPFLHLRKVESTLQTSLATSTNR
jgi:hypothetical protein